MKTWIGIAYLICFWMGIAPSSAQIEKNINDSFSFSVSAGEYGYDAGVSVEVGTPAYKDKFLVRLKASTTWLEAYKATYDEWATYKTINPSVVYNFIAREKVRPYAEAGGVLVLPGNTLSYKKAVVGVTCSLGTELFVISRPAFSICYYFSGGGIYANAYADRIEKKPRFSNGMFFSNGLRFYF